VSDLESPGLDPTRRATEEANLETFETYASAHHIALPSATAHHLARRAANTSDASRDWLAAAVSARAGLAVVVADASAVTASVMLAERRSEGRCSLVPARVVLSHRPGHRPRDGTP